MCKTIEYIGKILEEGNMGMLEWISLLHSHYSKSDWPSFPRQMPRLMRQYCKHNEQLPTQLWERSHGLRTPIEAFFHRHPKVLGFGRQFGQINSEVFGVILAELLAHILVQWVPCLCFQLFNYLLSLQKTKPLYPHPNIYLNLGCKELGI